MVDNNITVFPRDRNMDANIIEINLRTRKLNYFWYRYYDVNDPENKEVVMDFGPLLPLEEWLSLEEALDLIKKTQEDSWKSFLEAQKSASIPLVEPTTTNNVLKN